MTLSDYTDTMLLLPFHGSDGDTDFINCAPYRALVKVFGNAHAEADRYKFYNASLALDGTGDYATATLNSADGEIGSGDFTIEAYIYRVGTNKTQGIVDFRPNANGAYPLLYVHSGNSIRYFVSSADRITGTTAPLNTWSHIAVCRSSGVTKLFLDGVQTGSSWTDSTTYAYEGGPIYIGTTYLDAPLEGNIQDFCVSRYAKYTGTFTPPGRMMGTISNLGSGVSAVLDDTGAAAVRAVRAIPRGVSDPPVFSTVSNSSGRYEIFVPMVESSVIFEDDAAGDALADLVVTRVMPS